MTDGQEDHLSMIRTLLLLRLLYDTDIVALPDVANDFADLKTEADAIKALVPMQKLQTTGVARDKHDLEIELVQDAIILAGAVMAMASNAGNNTLFDEVKYSKSKLEHVRDTELSDTCRIIHSRANTNILALAGRGITPTMVTDFLTLITDYEAIDQTPRQATVQKSTATVGIAARFANTQKILTERLDTGMRVFITLKPELHTAFRNSRKIVNTGHRKKKNIPTGELDIMVRDSSNNPLENVLISSGSHITSTDSNGLAKLKGLDPGSINVRVYKQNYGEQSTLTTIINGQVTNLNVTLAATRGGITGQITSPTLSGPFNVIVQGMATGVSTNSAGQYTINDVGSGNQTVSAFPIANPANMESHNTVVNAGAVVTENFSFP